MAWAQYTIVALNLIGIGVSWARFGQPKKGAYDLFDCIVGPALGFWLLYSAGAFSAIGLAP